MGEKYAYIRVSTKEQNINRQLDAMDKLKIEKRNYFIDKQTGSDFNRNKYKKMMAKIKKGDEIYIKSIDRLGRNYDEILEQWRIITKEKGVDLIVLDFPLLDTRIKKDKLIGKFITDLILQILSYVAQVEKENIKERQAEGIASAKERGVKFGRPATVYPDGFGEVYKKYKYEDYSKRACARMLNTNHNTFSKWISLYEKTHRKNR